jgi:hypothetical protein
MSDVLRAARCKAGSLQGWRMSDVLRAALQGRELALAQ